MNSHRQRARRRTVVWQAACLALVAGAIGLGAVPLGLLGPRPFKAPAVATVSDAKLGAEPLTQGAFNKLTEAFNTITPSQPVTPVPAPPPPDPVTTASTETPPQPTLPQTVVWSYTGYLKAPNMRRALIQISGGETRQVMLAEGEADQSTRLKEIHPDHIVVEEGGNTRRIDLAARTAENSWNSDPPRRPMATGRITPPGAAPGMVPGATPPGYNPSAAAMADAQRRMKAAIGGPPQTGMPNPMEQARQAALEKAAAQNQISEEHRELLEKMMSEPGMSAEEREKIMREVGIPVEATPDERGEYLEKIGIHAEKQPKLHQYLRNGGSEK